MTLKNRIVLSLLSFLAILSFMKKKDGKSDKPASDDVQTSGGELSLGTLDGGLSSLSMLSSDDSNDEDLSDTLLAKSGSGGFSDRRMQELEVDMNDLNKQVETIERSSRVARGELDDIKVEINEINESIRNLLNVYEAISRPYNPFGDGGDLPDITPDISNGELSAGGVMMSTNLGELSDVPFDEEGPLDRIVRPDEEESATMLDINPMDLVDQTSVSSNSEAILQDTVARVSTADTSATTSFDPFVLEQFHKILVHQLGKIYNGCLKEGSMNNNDIDDLDRWLAEFKRIGGA